MTITQFLALFSEVKDTSKGWNVCCPAHDDHNPSLGVMEGDDGKIVLNCWAGCTAGAICAALSLTLADLFPDASKERPRTAPGCPQVKTLRRKSSVAWGFELHALDLRLASTRILEAARACTDCDTWTPEDRDLAMQAVSRAYAYQDRASFCENYADHLREIDYVDRQARAREQKVRRAAEQSTRL